MPLQIKLKTPSKILKGWAEVKEVDGEKVWSFAHDEFPAEENIPVGTFAHVVASKNDKTTIQVRNIYRVNKALEKGKWYNLLLVDGQWIIENESVVVDIKEGFEGFSKMKAIVQEVAEDSSLVEIASYVDMKRKSGYSILDSTININQMMLHTEFSGALTDDRLTSGLLKYYKLMKDQKKHAILGVTLKTPSINGEHNGDELTFIAKSQKGYYNMTTLSTQANRNLINEIPYLTEHVIKTYSEDVICVIPQETSELSKLVNENDFDLADAFVQGLQEAFGNENVYIGLSKHDTEESEMTALKLEKVAKTNGIKCVVASDTHMVNREDEDTHDVVRCIGLGITTDDERRFRYEGDYYHLLTNKEALDVYGQDVLWNTLELAQTLNVTIPLGVIHLPKFPLPEEFTSEEDYFKHLCWEGFNLRFENTEKDTEEYRERLDFEIQTILKMGFPGYFLIVADFMRFARDNKIKTGPGRGSACGSMVAYVMQITDVDPIEYGLLFERFLNPDRVSMPDYKLLVA